MKLPCEKCITLPVCYRTFKSINVVVGYIRLHEKCSLLRNFVEIYFAETTNDSPHPAEFLFDFMTKIERKIKDLE